MSDLEAQKTQLRSEMRPRRALLSNAEQQLASVALLKALTQLPMWNGSRSIALYMANDGEIDPAQIVSEAHRQKKDVLLPVVEQNTLSFAVCPEGEQLEVNRFGICEPGGNASRVAPNDIDIICLPLVAWSRNGARLGMGGGFYDRALADLHKASVVGLGHSFQEVEDIPMQEWDVQLQYVATEKGLITCRL